MNIRNICILTFALFLLTISACLAGKQKNSTKAPALTWRDAETKRVLFTSNDIISFDWDKQVFRLTRNATLDFLAWIPPHMHQARKLFVEDEQGLIYEAHWVSNVSSMGFRGPIYRPLSPNPLFSIVNGYPQNSGTTTMTKDLRFSPRLRAGLKKAGLLHSIDLKKKYEGLIIKTTGHMWKSIGNDLKVRVEYFDNTFRPGSKARAHVFFAGGKKTRKQIDSLIFQIKFVANSGTFRSDIRIARIPVSEIEDGIYVCKFAPWQPAEGSDQEAEPGTGLISLSILLQKQDKTVYRLDFSESCVPVGGRIKDEQKSPPGKK
jgi:hypothetical protein